MAEASYTIELQGGLDRAAATILVHELERRIAAGAREICLDCTALLWVHHSAMDLLVSDFEQACKACGSEATLSFDHMTDALSMQAGRTVDFSEDETEEEKDDEREKEEQPAVENEAEIAATSVDSLAVRSCRNCLSPLRIPKKGNYACPTCGIHFYADRNGRLVFYESLLHPDTVP